MKLFSISTPIISLKNVSASIGTERVLNNIDWTVYNGQHWVITGPSSSGKTALCKCIASKIRISEGELSFPFLDVQEEPRYPTDYIKMVSFTDESKLFHGVNNSHYYQQRFNAFDADGHLTMKDYLEIHGYISDDGAHQKVLRTLGITDLIDTERIKLSSGQTRKMLLAKVLIQKPKVIILDNPYIGLDALSRAVLNELLDDLALNENKTIILSGHYTSLPKCISHNAAMSHKSLVSTYPISEETVFPSVSIDYSVLNKIKTHLNTRANTVIKEVLRFDDVDISYNDITILKPLSWKVSSGEKWVLKGDNGTGKSTVVSLIYADNPQVYGKKVYLFGERRGRGGLSIWDIKKRIGYTSSELHSYFYRNYRAIDVVLTGLNDSFEKNKNPSTEKIELARLLFEYYDVTDYLSVRYEELSSGMQRLLFFMRALIKCPEFYLLDEPFQGFDMSMVDRSKTLLTKGLDDNHTLIFISHFDHEVPPIVSLTKVL